MAFGDSRRKAKPQTNDGEQKKFDPFWIDTHYGVRIVRILPLLDGNGKVLLDEYGRTQPENEVSWLEAWWPVMVNGAMSSRRFMFSEDSRWDNPLWKHIKENYDKGSREWKSFKTMFGINIYSTTPVVYDADGNKIYANDKNEFIVTAMGKDLPEPVKGDPKPENKILVLIGSNGAEDGKHFLNQLYELTSNVDHPKFEDATPELQKARLSEFDIRIGTKGKGTDTRRNPYPTTKFHMLPDDVATAPRYDIAEWVKPWSDAAVERLIDGADFNEIVEEYGITTFPSLKAVANNAAANTGETEKLTPPKTKKVTKKLQVEDEEGLFED